MNNEVQAIAAEALPAFRAITFDLAGQTRIFGWYHAPLPAAARRCAVVLCNPFAEAALSVHRTYRVFAETLAAAGYPTLRFDYDGTGDSAGSDDDPERLAAWIGSTHAAIETCKHLSGASAVALFGIRFGGTLATLVASERHDVSALMLWAPLANGRRFIREIRMLQATGAASRALAPTGTVDAPFDGLEAAGFRHSAKTVADIGGINLLKLPAPRIPTVLLDRDDVDPSPELQEAWQATGADITTLPLAGYAAMMRDAQYAEVPVAALKALASWLEQKCPASADGAAPVRSGGLSAVLSPAPCISGETSRVRELPAWFGESEELFGILARPETIRAQFADTAAIVLSAGGNHRIGPSRLSVPIARYLASLGCTTLRMDLAGLGDSLPVRENLPIFDISSVLDVRQGIDFLSNLEGLSIRRFVVIGLCSGGFVTMHAAIQDSRVNSQIIMNLPAFEASPNTSSERVAKLYIKPSSFYAAALMKPETWLRALRGNVDLKRVVAGMASKLLKRLAVKRQALLARLHMIRDRSIAAQFRRLGRRNVLSLMILSTNDGAVDEMEAHLGKNASRMRNERNFRLVMLSGADHTFTAQAARRDLLDSMRAHFERLVADVPS